MSNPPDIPTTKKTAHIGGKLGIKNLGNTCYLNSALQCLSHLEKLIEYSLSGNLQKDLDENIQNYQITSNPDDNFNKLSQFTINFNDFIHKMWDPPKEIQEQKVIIPSELRRSLIDIFQEFDNNNQQDAHEVLTLILDTLSTSLSHRKEKELNAMEIDDYTEKTIITHTEEQKFTCNSFIFENFFGQLKSTIQCSNCYKELNKHYDPFSSLELTTPFVYKIFLYFIPIKKNIRPIQLVVEINDNLQFKHIIPKVRNIIDYNFKSGTFYWVLDSKLKKIADLEERCGNLMKRMNFLFLIENNENIDEKKKPKFFTELNFKVIKETYSKRNTQKQISNEIEVVTFPRVFPFVLNEDTTLIYSSIFSELNDYIKQYKNFSEGNQNINTNNNNIINDEDDEAIKFDFNKCYFTISSNTKNGGLNHYCLVCQKEDEKEFECKCINEKLSKNDIDFQMNRTLREHIENLRDVEVMKVTYYFNTQLIKTRELNRCRDFTQKIIQEQSLNIYDLCDYFFQEENIESENDCPQCGKIKQCFKKQELNKFPQVLIFHLKRFHYGKGEKGEKGNANIGEKNEYLVNFNENIDLSKYNHDGKNGKYCLSSVIYHKGKISSGHYTAICKLEDRWVSFDDQKVQFVNGERETNIPYEDAYILFYRKCN